MMSKVVIATHNGGFHTDDVFAVAALEMYLSKQGAEEFEVIRTRDEEVIAQADYALDVGGTHDPKSGRFDHHQEDSPAPRGNSVPYASFGLVWREYGAEICDDEAIAEVLDQRLVQPIDGPDNGVFLTGQADIEGVYPYFLGNGVNVFNPTWKEDPELANANFLKMVESAKVLIKREIEATADVLEGEELTRAAYEAAEDKRLIFLEEKYPWKRVLSEFSEPVLAIYPDTEGRWRLQAVPDNDFQTRIVFPEGWRGKHGEYLEEVTGVPGVVFCHKSLPMLVTETKEAAETLARELLAD